MNTKSNTLPSSELIQIGGIGFMFEVNQSLKHNLINPAILTFFDGVQASEKVTEDYAFPLPISNTNLCQTYFQYIGDDWVVCSDGVFRKCPKVKYKVNYKSSIHEMDFMIDKTLNDETKAGIVSLKLL